MLPGICLHFEHHLTLIKIPCRTQQKNSFASHKGRASRQKKVASPYATTIQKKSCIHKYLESMKPELALYYSTIEYFWDTHKPCNDCTHWLTKKKLKASYNTPKKDTAFHPLSATPRYAQASSRIFAVSVCFSFTLPKWASIFLLHVEACRSKQWK